MPLVRPARSAVRHRGSSVLVGAGVLVLLVSGCSSPAPVTEVAAGDVPGQREVVSSILERAESMGLDPDLADDEPDGSEDGSPQQQEMPPLKRWLPAEPVGDPAGWQRSPIHCLDREEAIGSAYVGFAVPGDWDLGRRSGGSGSPGGMGFDYGFRPADLGEVTIAIESDNRNSDGELQPAYDGQPESESTFDYDYRAGDDTVRITFDAVGEQPVGDSRTTVYVARPEQAPDRLKDVVFKARINQFDLPGPTFDGGWTATPKSFTIEISYRPDEGEVPEETVRSIISSLVMPDCSVNISVVLAEMTGGVDINGDGHVSTQQDYIDAMQAGG